MAAGAQLDQLFSNINVTLTIDVGLGEVAGTPTPSGPETASQKLDQLFSNINVTLTIDVGLGEVAGTPIPDGAIAEGGPAAGGYLTYAQTKLRAYHRLALRIHKMLPEADITGIVDAIVFGIRCDDKSEDQMLESALALLDEQPLGYIVARYGSRANWLRRFEDTEA
jgi:hypothetical protein